VVTCSDICTGPVGAPGQRGSKGPRGHMGATGATGEPGIRFQSARQRVRRQARGCPGNLQYVNSRHRLSNVGYITHSHVGAR